MMDTSIRFDWMACFSTMKKSLHRKSSKVRQAFRQIDWYVGSLKAGSHVGKT